MKEIYLLRHAEKDINGTLTVAGKQSARELGRRLPEFASVTASPSSRAKETAKLLTDKDPSVEDRAGFYMASQEKSDAINQIAAEQNISFLDAAGKYQDSEVLQGIDAKATELNTLIDELLQTLDDGEAALVVSHDLSISPAMKQRGNIALESIDFLQGYTITDQHDIIPTTQQK